MTTRRRTIIRRVQITLLCVGVLMTVLSATLVAAAWRDDRAIEANMGTANADVLSAGARRSTISFYTPDGSNFNPPLGVLYPSELTVGDRIVVEYSRDTPELVRVAGRTAAVAVIPAISVALGSWAAIAVIMVVIAQTNRRWLTDT